MRSVQKGLIAALMLVLAIFTSCRGKSKETSGKETKPAASGYTVTITEEAQRTGGVTTEVLTPILYQKSLVAFGKVLSADGFNDSRNHYVSASAGLEKAEAALNASEKEYERMKALNESAKNVSDRAFQAAAAQCASDRANLTQAYGALQSAKDAIRLQWGPILAGWIFDYSASLRSILGTRTVLVQITIPPGAPLQGLPKEARIESPAGGAVSARLVSRATSADPQIQGMSFIYVAPSRLGSLIPGMNVTAQLPSVRRQAGFLVPDSAVVWLQDRAWVYVRKGETGFSRVEVPTSTGVDGGYFVSGVFSAGDELVVKGAQALLSEESRPQAEGGGGEEEDED